MQNIGNDLSEKGITVYMPEPSEFRTLEDLTKFSREFFSQERSKRMDEIRERTLRHLEKIDKSDSIYVVAGNECHRKIEFKDAEIAEVGYVGISTSLEMGYAHGKKKPISLRWKDEPVPIRPAMNEDNIFYFYNIDEGIFLPLSEANGIALQIGYAFAFGKPIYIMEPCHDVSDYPIESVSKGAVSPEELLRRIKNGSIKRN
jgi:nucleoside 2-deoxyribosyltransferase